MTLGDTLGLALRNLGQAKLRTALTTLGVAIGIASLAGMVSLGVGLEEQLVGQFVKSGVFDAVTVVPAQTGRLAMAGRRGLGRGLRPDITATAPDAPLDDEALAKIAALPDVTEAYPNIRVPIEVQFDQFTGFAAVSGVAMSSRHDGAFQNFIAGGFFANDADAGCLITLDMAKRLSDAEPRTLLGREVTFAYASATASAHRVSRSCTITGILEREPTMGPGGGAGPTGVMIPLAQAEVIDADALASAQALLRDPAKRKTYATATVRVARPQATQDVEDRIKAMGFSAFSLADALQAAKRAFIILDIVLSLIGSIALAVSSLGIINTMVMSILERTREIGIMKAIGGDNADIRRIFLVEASTIGLFGGVIGVTLGWLVGRVINFGANIYIERQGGIAGNLFSLPLWLIGGAIAFSWLVSLLAGSYPAGRAARLDPIQALRHD